MRRLAPLPVILVVLAHPIAGQPPAEQPAQPPVFRSGASLVAVNVTVTGPDQRFVTGLSAGDFAIYEDGIQQEVRFFESAHVPMDFIILIDTSSSMRHVMDMVHRAAIGFVSNLRDGDRGAVVAFSDRVEVMQPLTGDRAQLGQAIRSTVAKGGTALYNAIYVSLKEFGRAAQQEGEIRRQAIALLSDGDDTASLIGFDDVLETARRSGVSIYPIALQSEFTYEGRGHFSESQFSMRTLARETGAQAFFPTKAAELSGIYTAIAEELSNQYSIGYASSNMRSDGRFRRIIVRVPTRPDLRPRARAGYISGPEHASTNEYQSQGH